MHGPFSKILGGGTGPRPPGSTPLIISLVIIIYVARFRVTLTKKISVQYLTLPCGLDVLPSNTEASTCSSPT